jgi:hypothetical protein
MPGAVEVEGMIVLVTPLAMDVIQGRLESAGMFEDVDNVGHGRLTVLSVRGKADAGNMES